METWQISVQNRGEEASDEIVLGKHRVLTLIRLRPLTRCNDVGSRFPATSPVLLEQCPETVVQPSVDSQRRVVRDDPDVLSTIIGVLEDYSDCRAAAKSKCRDRFMSLASCPQASFAVHVDQSRAEALLSFVKGRPPITVIEHEFHASESSVGVHVEPRFT